jgi:Xaa-Pro aminopeptidase
MAPPPPAPPPPPPPPICFPFTSKRPKRPVSWSSSERSRSPLPFSHSERRIVRHPSYPTSTHAESITFHSDSEKYDEVPEALPANYKGEKGRPKLARSNTMTGTKKSTASSKWGYGWGVGRRDREREREEEVNENPSSLGMAIYQPVVRRDSKSTQSSRRTQDTARTQDTVRTHDTQRTYTSHQSKSSAQSKETYRSGGSRSTAPKPRPPILGTLEHHDSTSTLVGSAFERKINDHESTRSKADTTERLEEMRRLMGKDNLDY